MVLDLGALVYISSAGLRVLLLVAKDMQNIFPLAQTLQSAPSRGRSGSFSRSAASTRSIQISDSQEDAISSFMA